MKTRTPSAAPTEIAPPLLTPGDPEAPTPQRLKVPVLPPEFTPGVVRLHILEPGVVLKRDSGPVVQVYEHSGEHAAAAVVCTSPCDAVIDARAGSRFVFGGGDNMPDSSRFDLLDRSGDVTAQVLKGDGAMRKAGIILMYVGGLTSLFGLIGIGIDSLLSTGLSLPTELVLAAAGGMAITGLLLYFLSSTTYQLQTSGIAPSATSMSTSTPSKAPAILNPSLQAPPT
jgi:hypothetical protein